MTTYTTDKIATTALAIITLIISSMLNATWLLVCRYKTLEMGLCMAMAMYNIILLSTCFLYIEYTIDTCRDKSLGFTDIRPNITTILWYVLQFIILNIPNIIGIFILIVIWF